MIHNHFLFVSTIMEEDEIQLSPSFFFFANIMRQVYQYVLPALKVQIQNNQKKSVLRVLIGILVNFLNLHF